MEGEALGSILSGELYVGAMLQGKRIRDVNRTSLQTGIHCWQCCHSAQKAVGRRKRQQALLGPAPLMS